MERLLFCVLFIYVVQYAEGFDQLRYDICGNNTQRAKSCTTQILGDDSVDVNKCHIEYYEANSNKCRSMDFGPINSNSYIGGVSLRPYILSVDRLGNGSFFSTNRAVLNITFSNIKWKTMKFRFQNAKKRHNENHCRDIILSNDVTVDDQSILYYDCYWPIMDSTLSGQSHSLDYEASDDSVVNRGQYYFNVPSAKMLSQTVTEKEWLPFLYIELLTPAMKLHIVPPPKQLNITGYHIKIMKETEKGPQVEMITDIKVKNNSQEVTYESSLLVNGLYFFMVTPQHENCKGDGPGCQTVESPRLDIRSNVQTWNICIVSLTGLCVGILFAYYIALRSIRRYCCKDYSLAFAHELPPPPKVLVIYSSANRIHAECVASFVTYLRSEYGFDIMYDGDVQYTAHADPAIWAVQAFEVATHLLYIVSPTEDTNIYNNIYDKPIISPHRDLDKLMLSYIPRNRISNTRKPILNVFFEHSNGQVPVETSRHDEAFFLLKDWNKFIAYLSKNLLPKKHIQRTEKGRCFIEDLDKAKKLLTSKPDKVTIKCEKVNFCDKKVLI